MADEKKTDDKQTPPQDDQLKLVTANLESMNQLVTGLMQKVAALEETPAPAADDDSAKPPTLDESSLEEMSRTDFAKAIMGQFQAGIDQLAKRFDNQVETLTNSVRTIDASTQVKEAAREHKDFWDWRAEMKTLSDKHPTMSAEELYATARAGNADKAKELDTKYQAPQDTPPADETGGKDAKPGLFGGLQPSTIDTPAQPENMTFETASEKAWQENMAGLNEVLNSG